MKHVLPRFCSPTHPLPGPRSRMPHVDRVGKDASWPTTPQPLSLSPAAPNPRLPRCCSSASSEHESPEGGPSLEVCDPVARQLVAVEG